MMMFTIMMSMNLAYHGNYFLYIYFTAYNILLQMLAEDNSAGSVVDANYNVDDDNEVE
jgi:hypothetical protein